MRSVSAIGTGVLAVLMLNGAPHAQIRLNHADIVGRWCGANDTWRISRRQLVITRRKDGRKTTVPVRYFIFGLNRVTLYGRSSGGAPTQMHLLNLSPLGPTFRHLKGGLFRRC